MQIEENAMGSYMEIKESGMNGNKLYFNIWVTTSCNYACTYCYESSKKNLFMDADTADQVVKFIDDISRVSSGDSISINFHGGEPTLNIPIIEHIINRIKNNASLKIYTSMTTNCSVFYEEGIKELDELTVSIDGSRITHDKNRKLSNGKGTFDCSFQNALLYLRNHHNIKLNMVITAQTVGEVHDNIMFLINHGFKTIMPHINYYDTEWSENDFETLYEQLKKTKDEIRNQELQDIQIGLLDQHIGRKGRCIVGECHFQIYPDGNLYPCSVVAGVPKYCYGNVKVGIDKNKVKQLNSLMNPPISECMDCKYYDFCETCRCYFVNETLNGSMYIPSGVVCAMEHLKIRLKRT